jgi:hypothetical protein
MTLLVTDIEGSTTLLQRVGEDVDGRALAEHHALIRSSLASYDGTELTMTSTAGRCLTGQLAKTWNSQSE